MKQIIKLGRKEANPTEMLKKMGTLQDSHVHTVMGAFTESNKVCPDR